MTWSTNRWLGDACMNECLETPKQLAERVGLTERQIRHLIKTRQLEHVWIGCRVHVPTGAFARFLEARKVTPCQDETKDRVSVGSSKRNCFYITWTEHGRSRERSTGTADREQAEVVFAEWLQRRGRRDGPSDPAAILVTDVLNRLPARARTEGRGTGAHRICGAGADRLLRGQHGRGCDAADLRPLRREARALDRDRQARIGRAAGRDQLRAQDAAGSRAPCRGASRTPRAA